MAVAGLIRALIAMCFLVLQFSATILESGKIGATLDSKQSSAIWIQTGDGQKGSLVANRTVGNAWIQVEDDSGETAGVTWSSPCVNISANPSAKITLFLNATGDLQILVASVIKWNTNTQGVAYAEISDDGGINLKASDNSTIWKSSDSSIATATQCVSASDPDFGKFGPIAADPPPPPSSSEQSKNSAETPILGTFLIIGTLAISAIVAL